MSTIRIIWNDGSMTSGRTWREVEDSIRAAQWVSYSSRREFRKDMRKRAGVWSGIVPARTLTSERFIKSLADRGMFLITREKETVR